jgi:general secretion pathway protein D
VAHRLLQAAPRTRHALNALTLLLVLSATSPKELPLTPAQDCASLRKTARFTIHFDKVELDKLVQTVADATCRTFILPDSLRGKISIVGPENGSAELDSDQFYATFLSALEANGLTVYPSGRFLKIVERGRARQSNIPLVIDGEGPGGEQMITRVFKLQHAELEPLRALVSQFVAGNDVIGFPPNVLIASDVASNIRRVEKLIASLDVPKDGEQLRVYPVRYAEARDAAEKLGRILADQKPLPKLLADERSNKLLVIAQLTAFDRIEKTLAELDVNVPDDGQVNIYKLEHADSKEVAQSLDALAQGAKKLFSGEVKVTHSESNNALLIVANQADYRSLARVIGELDAPRRQVFIEAVLMEVNLSRGTQFGVSAHGVPQVTTDKGQLPIFLGSNPSASGPSSLDVKTLAGVAGMVAGIQGPILQPLSDTLGIKLPEMGIVVQALASSSDVNVLSTPHILTTDNKEAEISVGQKIPFQTGVAPASYTQLLNAATNGQSLTQVPQIATNVTREKVELKLTVKPHIASDDEVQLEVTESTEELAGGDSRGLGPTTSTRSEKTSIIARDRQTVVLGGIMQDRTIEDVSKVPILGDLPVLGHLFRSTSRTKVKTNLLLFLTPYIVRDESDFQRIYERKMEERQRFVEEFYGEVPGADSQINFRRKKGPLAAIDAAIRYEKNRPENGGSGNEGEKVIAPGTSP